MLRRLTKQLAKLASQPRTRSNKNQPRPNVPRTQRFRARAQRRGYRRMIPAASVPTLAKQFSILYQDGNTVKVTGRDLIYQIPQTLTAQSASQVITVIPANPAYWIGTRIGALAQGYQNYRPVDFRVHYIPQCAVTQQGNVLAGTLWNQAPQADALQQSLRTSNGGVLTQCYKAATSIIRMKTNLQYNLFRMGGQFDQESNPFLYIAMAIGCLDTNNNPIIPGYFYVTWSFVLKNPIGQSITYSNSGIIQYSQIETPPTNKSCVYLKNSDAIPCGAVLQLETDSNLNTVPYYNGTAVSVDNADPVWQFSNTTIKAASELAANKAKTEGRIEGLTKRILYNAVTTATTTITPLVYIYYDGVTRGYRAVVVRTAEAVSVPAGTYYITDENLIGQDFGTLLSISTGAAQFYLDPRYTVFAPAPAERAQQPQLLKEEDSKEHLSISLLDSGD